MNSRIFIIFEILFRLLNQTVICWWIKIIIFLQHMIIVEYLNYLQR